jgi:pyruvate dehydrogenase E1 component alpha subunit
VTACFFGEGAAAEGEFHESLNLAALWRLPVLFVCENNLYAMGTALELSESETDISAKAACYRIASEAVDGMNVVEVEAAARRAAAAVRAGEGPRFLECRTYRFRAHSMFDPQLYRDKSEVEEWMERDPIPSFRDWAISAGEIHESDVKTIEERWRRRSPEAVTFAEAGSWEPVADLLKDVGAERRT